MPVLVIVPLVVALGIYFIPVDLLRRKASGRAQDYFVSSEHTPPGVIQNSSIAYALRMATFGPFFALGARGDFWPAIVNSAFFGFGLYLLYVLRRPILEFLDIALSRDGSITVHEFIARQHGNDQRVRLLASGLTVFALLGLAMGETLGVATLLKPILLGAAGSTYMFIFGMSILMVLYTILAGNSGVMRSAQTQLGLLYLGLFGSTALLLYMLISALRPMPPHGTFAVMFVAACCTIMLCYRRSRYVDTSPIAESGSEPLRGRLFRRFEKILNVVISVLAVLAILLALMELYAEGLPAILRNSAAALQAAPGIPSMGLIALFLLPLFYPIVDMTNWQRIAAFEKDAAANEAAPSGQRSVFRSILGVYAAETILLWLFMCMFGAIAVVSTATPDGADVMQAFIRQLASQDNLVATGALSLLLVSVVAMAFSTMMSVFSASLCTIRYDILPVLCPELASGKAQAEEAMARRRTILAAVGLYLVIAMTFYIADAYLQISFTGSAFVALLFAFYCAQLSFVPLILGPVIARTSAGFGTVSAGWALVILGFSAAIGVGAVTVYVTTGDDPWLWAAVPACLGSGFLLFTIARIWPGETARAA